MQAEIRAAIAKIPRGRVATYGSVAGAAGHPGAARQVAWTLHSSGGKLPWHRVVGAGGRVLLPGQPGLEQRLRLKNEGVPFRGDRVDLSRCEWKFSA